MKKSIREPEYLYSEQDACEKSSLADSFIKGRTDQNELVDKANNKLIKRFYNIDHNVYLEGGVLPASIKELMGLVASLALRCDDCIFYHIIQAWRLGQSVEAIRESIDVAMVVGGSITIPHLRRAYQLIDQLYAD